MSSEQRRSIDPEATVSPSPADPQAQSEVTVEVVQAPANPRSESALNFPEALAEMGMKLGDVMGGTALSVGKAAIDTAVGVGGAMTQAAAQTGKTIVDTATELSEALSRTTHQNSKTAIETANAVSEVVGSTTAHASRTMVDLATWMSEAAKWMGESSAKQVYTWLEQTTQGTGQVVSAAGNNSVVRRLSGVLKLDWLMGISDRVDLQKAEAEVRKIQQKYPDEAPSQIAHRIMVEKAVYAGGMGLASSLIPGAALALLAVDLAATTALQTEMVYQIAAAYGLDLQDPARKGEVLAIFGLALGGSKALRAGLSFLRNVPLAGAMIGAGTNATMLYSLGYAACRFYAAKQAAAQPEPSVETLEALKQESDRYLEVAIAQQTVMDQILVHMVLASYPQRTWETVLPELKRLQLSEASLEAIEAHVKSPQPLGALLNQLNQDFAIPLLAQCYRIARSTGEAVSEAEAQVLNAIAEKFSIELAAVEQALQGRSLAEIEGLQRVSVR